MPSHLRALGALALVLSACAPPSRSDEDTTPPAKCATLADCAAGLACLSGLCGSCTADADCGAGRACHSGSCVTPVACQSDLQCKATNEVCDTVHHTCVPCNLAADCAGSLACLGNACVSVKTCQSSRDCGAQEVCAPAEGPKYPASANGHVCAQCATNNDCAAGHACEEGRCVDVCGARKCGSVQGASCGTCASGGICAGDGLACLEPLQLDVYQPDSMAAAGNVLFVSTRDSSSSVYKAVRGGRSSRIGSYSGYVNNVSTNGTAVHWFVATPGGASTLYGLPVSGGTVKTIWTTSTSDCYLIASGADAVYCHSSDNGGEWFGVYRIPLAGGTPTKITPTNQRIDFDAILPTAERVYLGSNNESFAAWTVPAGGSLHTLSHNQVSHPVMVLDDQNLYFSGYQGVFSVPKNGGTTKRLLGGANASNDAAIVGLVGTSLYLVDKQALVALDTATLAKRTVVSAEELPIRMAAMSGKTVFLASSSRGFFVLDVP